MGGVSKKRKRRFKALAETAYRQSSDSPSTSSLPPGPPTAAATGSCMESSLTTLDDYRVDSAASMSESEYIPTLIKRMTRHDAGKVHLVIT